MPRSAFRRPAHRGVVAALARFDRMLLDRCQCYFGGGTRIVLELGEYRESRDIDFLCASREGYRRLRESVSDASLGNLAPRAPAPVRDVRSDQYGIRTWLEEGSLRIKFEILREARIDLAGCTVPGIPVACLGRAHAFAEKFLANADRGLDASTLSRDAIDLAFMIESWPAREAADGLSIALDAYGADTERKLTAVVTRLREDKAYRSRAIEGLAIADPKTLSAGLAALASGKWRKPARGS